MRALWVCFVHCLLCKITASCRPDDDFNSDGSQQVIGREHSNPSSLAEATATSMKSNYTVGGYCPVPSTEDGERWMKVQKEWQKLNYKIDLFTFPAKSGKLLGKGTFGSVYQVELMRDGQQKTFAMKIEFAKSTGNDVTVQEALLLKGFAGVKGLIPGFEHVEYKVKEGLCVYILEEFAEGGNLAKFLPKSKDEKVDRKVIANFMVDLLTGLKALHDKGFVHKDIKLENIMVTGTSPNEQAKLGDLGVACCERTTQCVDPKGEKYPAATCEVAWVPYGTELYISPWQCKPYVYLEKRVKPWMITAKDDLWATGLVLYQLLLGEARPITYGEIELFKMKDEWNVPAGPETGEPRDRMKIQVQKGMADMKEGSVLISDTDRAKLDIKVEQGDSAEIKLAKQLADKLLDSLQRPTDTKTALENALNWRNHLMK